MKINKIFLGLSNISSTITDYMHGFSELGVETMTAVHTAATIQRDSCDYNISNLLPKKEWFDDNELGDTVIEYCKKNLMQHVWRKAVAECDVFCFFYHTFRHDKSDLAELKKLGKKIIVFFCGDDVRWPHACNQEFDIFGYRKIEYNQNYLNKINIQLKLQYLRAAEYYADVIFASPLSMQLAIRPYFKHIIPINNNQFIPSVYQNTDPTIIHAPSNSEFKGTRYVLDAVERLKQEGLRFNFQLIQNMPNDEALNRYRSADILVGQLLAPGGGKQALEFLSLGKVVLSCMHHFGYLKTPPDCPIIDVTPDNILEKLRSVISSYDLRMELAKKGRPYVIKNHDLIKQCERILQLIEHTESKPDFYPAFFRNQYLPGSVVETNICNEYNLKVKDCSWYQNNVLHGERNGLFF